MIWCLVGFTFLFSSFFMLFMKKEDLIFRKFNQLLTEEQRDTYISIIQERLKIYIIGSCMGIISAIYYYIAYPKDKNRICKSLSILYLVKLMIYYFYPKKPLMLYSLTTKKQTDEWARIYEGMKSIYQRSLLYGLLGYILLFNYNCN